MTRRRLSDDERTLWRGVTRSIAPLRKPSPVEPDDVAPPTAAKSRSKPAPAKSAPHKPAAPAAMQKPSAPPPPAPLGRKRRKRIARGSDALDGRLDLHGMTQAEAHDALFGYLHRKQASGGKLVLVITGKGVAGGEGRGVLKRMVPLWLGLPEFRTLVVGFEAAGIGHGGEGALYVSLRRARSP